MKETSGEIEYILGELNGKNAEVALRKIIGLYSSSMVRYIYMYVRNEETAREIASDVFLVVWKNRENIDEIIDFKSYIYRIAKYRAISHLRLRKPDIVGVDDYRIDIFESTMTTPEESLLGTEMAGQINEAIEQLPVKCKLVFKLIREDGMSYRQASEHLDLSVKTIEAHLYTAMQKIRNHLKKNSCL